MSAQVFATTAFECLAGFIVDMEPPNEFPLCDHTEPGHPPVGRWFKVPAREVSVGFGKGPRRWWGTRSFLTDYEPRLHKKVGPGWRKSPQYSRRGPYLRFVIPSASKKTKTVTFSHQLLLDYMWFR